MRLPPSSARQSRAQSLAALVLVAAATTSFYGDLLRDDPSRVVPLASPTGMGADSAGAAFAIMDYRYSVWAVSRNARVLVTQPTQLYRAEICYPHPKSLALGHSVLTMGVLGIAPFFLTRDPLLTHNFVLILLTLLSAFAMFLLVNDWTKLPLAGAVAAIFYAFHVLKIADVAHQYCIDTCWAVFSLFFARRLFERGSWRDALGLGVCGALQVMTGIYPVIAVFVIAVPLGAWLLLTYGPRAIAPSRLGLVLALVSAAMLVEFLPYLQSAASEDLPERGRLFLPWVALLPGGIFFPGWFYLLLAIIGLALGHRATRLAGRPNPTWALGIALVAACAVATGGNAGDRLLAQMTGAPVPEPWPNPYEWLMAVVPGMASVRAPSLTHGGIQTVLSLLAGLGAATCIRLAPKRFATATAAVLVIVAYVETIRPAWAGVAPRIDSKLLPLAPASEDIQFLRELSARGNAGPILELPILQGLLRTERASRQALLASYHDRPTSECYQSFVGGTEAAEVARTLPEPDAIDRLREMGFTTLLIHHRDANQPALRLRDALAEAASNGAALREIARSAALTAFELRPSAKSNARPRE